MVQPSRKGKKAWRKNIDITDVEETLEELRKEEIAGGRITERTDEQLFTMDTSGDKEVKRKLASKRTLRIDEILAERSAVPSVVARAKKQASSGNPVEKLVQVVKRKLKKGALKPNSAKKEAAHKRASKKAAEHLWDQDDVAVPQKPELPDEVLTNPYLEPIIPKLVKKPASMVKPKVAEVQPAVAVVHPGASYNPKFHDHQNALSLAVSGEMDRLEAAEKLDQVAPNTRVLWAVQGQSADVTMRVDLEDDEEADAMEQDAEEADETEQNGKTNKEPKRKTKAQRRRAERQKKLEQEIADKKRQIKIANEAEAAKHLKKKLDKNAKKSAMEREEREKNKAEKDAARTLRASKHKFRDLPMAVQLSEDLADSLRQVKPEGNSFKDRFNSLQKRSLIETRVPVSDRRRYQLKEYEKHSYKQFK